MDDTDPLPAHGGCTPAGESYGASSYGDAFADVYDTWYQTLGDEQACVDALAELAGAGADSHEDGPSRRAGRVLELGVGTGRLAIPLAARGLDVTGIDASAAMLERLRAKPGSEGVRLVLGDMADVGVSEAFRLVLIAYNTLFNLPDVPSQRRCLEGVARVLEPGGTFVVEAFVPPDEPTPIGPVAQVRSATRDGVALTVSTHDAERSTITGHHVDATRGEVRVRPWRVHYLHPDELDALAADAGLTLVARHSDWSGGAFDDTSPAHVSRYVPTALSEMRDRSRFAAF